MTVKQKAKTGRKWHGQGTPRRFTSNREEIVRQLYVDLKDWEAKLAPEKIAELIAAHLDKYHGQNPKLIAMQDQYATDVDAHGAWRERGRTNIGSDNGIKIVSPNIKPWCKACKERENHPNHKGGHEFDPVVEFFYDVIYDIRHTIPDTAAAREAWRDDHPADPEGKRYWDDADNYKDYEKYGAIL
jgi:hypothetical protein